MTQLTPTERLTKAKLAIMRHKTWCVFSGVLACGKHTLDESCRTAVTDGWNVRYAPSFIESLTDPQLRFLILHEAVHIAFRHLTVWRNLFKEDQRTANIAADHFVNLTLETGDKRERFIVMPDVGVQPENKYQGWSVQMIYADLKQQGDDKQDGSGSGSDGDGLDEHDMSGADVSEKEAESQAAAIDRALRQGAALQRSMGGGSGGADGVLGDLLQPKADWRTVLRDFVNETCAGRDESSWRRPNRRYLSDDTYMPSMQGVTITRLVVGIDTSGSCFGSADMTRFVSELAAIVEQVKPSTVDVLYVDSEVAGFQTFEDGQFAVHNVAPKGGGGTYMPAVFDWCTANSVNPDACIILTDGYTPWGSAPAFPVLWAINTSIKAPYGTTLDIR